MRFLFGHCLVITSALLWATAGVATHVAPAGVSAAVFSVARLLLGGGMLVLVIGPRHFFHTVPVLPRVPLIIASIAMALFQWSFFAAIPGAGMSVTALISAVTAPFCADVIVAAIGRQPLTVQWRLALLFACAGIFYIGLGKQVSMRGLLLALASGAAYAAYTLAAAKLEQAQRGAGMAGTALALLNAGITLMPVAAPNLSTLITPRGIGIAMYLGIVTTALAYRFFVTGLRQLVPGTALMLLYIQPAAALLMGVLLMKERLEYLELLGAAHMAAAALFHLRSAGGERQMHLISLEHLS